MKMPFPSTATTIADEEIEKNQVLVLCNHCDNPPCVRACPTKATFKNKDGIVAMDYHRCIGCRFCMAACPYGSRSFNWRDPRNGLDMNNINREFPTRMRGVVEKCNFCADRLGRGEQPACVDATGDSKAMVFGDLNDPNSEIRQVLKEKFTIQRKAFSRYALHQSFILYEVAMFEKALKGNNYYWIWLAFLGTFMAIGALCYIRQYMYGLGLTGMSRSVSWGLYISHFTFLVGVAAGGVMLVLPYYIHNYKVFGRITILGEFLAIAAICHVPDVHHRRPRSADPGPERSSAPDTQFHALLGHDRAQRLPVPEHTLRLGHPDG